MEVFMTNDRKSGYQRAISRELFTEVACDYVLPDYLGEVRKILYTEARAMPLPTYMNGEEACASGGVRFRMVYVDAEGRLSSADFSEDYEIHERIVCDVLAGVSADTAIESCSMRLLGPRKISAKARLCVKLSVLTEETAEISGSALEAGEPELSDVSASVVDMVISEPAEREYAEELVTLDGVIADEVRVVYENAVSEISECRAADGEIWVSGEHRVCALVTVGDGPACLYKKSIPFAETISLAGANEGMQASVDVFLPSVKINVMPTDTGSTLVAALVAEYTPTAQGNREITLVTDGYMTDREVACEYGEITLDSLTARKQMTEIYRSDVSAEELSLESPSELLYLTAEPRIKSVETTCDGVKITAEIRFSGIACEINGEKTAYAPIRHASEWHYEIPLEFDTPHPIRPHISLVATSCEGRVGEDGISLAAELGIGLNLISIATYHRLCRIDAVGEAQKCDRQGGILVYYPDREDTLFSVARRFHTTPKRVAIDNALTESALADRGGASSLLGVERLIIK
jgi:hypothetical protein